MKFRKKLRSEQPLPQSISHEAEAKNVNGNGHGVVPFSETSSDGFCRFDNAWNFIYINEAAELFFGQAGKSLMGKRVWDLFPHLVGTRFFREGQRAVSERRPLKLEEFFDETKLWFSVRICPSEEGVGVYFRDVTERKQLEAYLRETTLASRQHTGRESHQAKERFDHLAGVFDGIFYDWDIHSGEVMRTEGVKKILGFEAEEVLSTPEWWNERIHPKDLERIRPEFIAKLRHGPSFSFEYRVRNKLDQYVHVKDQATILRDGDGHITRLLGCITDVTEKHESAESLEKWKSLFDQASWGMALTNAVTNRIEFVNAAYAEMHGYTPQELKGMEFRTLYPPEELGKLQAHLPAFEKEGHVVFESIHLRKDGTAFPVRIEGFAQRDSEGRIVRRTVHCQDITERRRAEALQQQLARAMALRGDVGAAFAQSRDSLQKILSLCTDAMVRHLDAAAAHIWILGESSGVLELLASSGRTDATGMPSRIAMGESFLGMLARERKPLLSGDITLDLRVEQAEWMKQENVRSFAGYPLLVEEKVVGVMALFASKPFPETFQETLASLAIMLAEGTERKRFSAALTESREQLEMALQSARMGHWMWNIQTNEMKWSAHLEELHGLKPGTFGGTFDAFLECVHAEDREGVKQAMQRAVETKSDYRVEFRVNGAQGVRWMQGCGKVYCDAQGNPFRVLGMAIDVTERKQAEMDLAQAREKLRGYTGELEQRVMERTTKLQEVSNEMESFSYSVSHDLRGPLRAMRGFAQALLDDYATQLDEAGRDFASRIVHASERMDRLIQDLLSYSRVTRSEIELEIVHLGKLVDDVLEQHRADLERTGAIIRVDGELPLVQAHYFTLFQAFANILENALKFVESGAKPRIVIRADVVKDQVRLYVEDNGIGIAPEYQDRVFRMFERLHSLDAYPGTGVGLAIVRKAVERMGGQVGMESEPGKGTSFWIELPKPHLDA